MPEPDKQPRGPLLIVSGASGSGKSTVIRRVLAEVRRPLRLSVSATTRGMRPGEKEGVDYYFWKRDRFEKGIREDAFLEYAQVHGNYYGTLRSEVEPYLARGIGVILDIDVQGAAQVRERLSRHVSIFLRTSSLDSTEARLRSRGTETEEAIARRLAGARRELEHAPLYDHQIVNDDLERAVAQMVALVEKTFEGVSDA